MMHYAARTHHIIMNVQRLKGNFHFIKKILDTMVNPVSYKDRKGIYREVNEAYVRKIAGIPREEIIGDTLFGISKKISNIFPKRIAVEEKSLLESCNEWTQQDMEVMETGRTRTDEQELIVADGTKKTFIVNKSALSDEKGEIIGIVTVMQDVTELRKIEKALKENLDYKDKLNDQLERSEERYHIVTEKTGQIVYDYDMEKDRTTWTGAMEKLTGYSPDYFQNSSEVLWISHLHPEDRERILEIYHEHLEKGEDFQIEYRFRKRDGSYIYIEDNSTFLINENGKVVRNLGVMKDITERKLARQQLGKSEEKYLTAAEQTGQVIFDFKFKTGEIEWAGAIKEVTGYDPEEFKGFNKSVWLENVHPEDRPKMLEMLMKSFEKREKFQMNFRFRKKDGSYTYIEERGVWLKGEEGNGHRAIGVMKDISEWKRAMEKVEASEKKYRSFIQNFQGIAFQADENFGILFVHGAVEKITGYTEEEFMSRINWKDIIYPDDLPLIFKEENIQSSLNDYGKIDFRIIRKDGKIIWVSVIYQKFWEKDGKPNYYQGIIYDVTERKETEKFLANIEIARQKEIHHRIKNNLQVISSLLDLQAEIFSSMESIKISEVLDAFKESQDRVASIALIHEELYEGEGAETLNFSQYLEKLVENLFQTYRFGSTDVRLKMDLEENILFDMDTAVPLGIIVNELVSNSLKHAFFGRKTGEIKIKLCRKEFEGYRISREEEGFEGKSTDFILTVSDNGIGIPKTVDFENPETLGLQLVSILADQLDGRIELRREAGTKYVLGFNVKNKF